MNRKPYILLDHDGNAYECLTPGKFGGHRGNKIYGTLDCPGARYWIAKGHYVKQRVFFATESDAIRAGYRPCWRCLREDYRMWKEDPEKYRRQKLGG